jgi:hypothetical protein
LILQIKLLFEIELFGKPGITIECMSIPSAVEMKQELMSCFCSCVDE